jgi:hypothetical protein
MAPSARDPCKCSSVAAGSWAIGRDAAARYGPAIQPDCNRQRTRRRESPLARRRAGKSLPRCSHWNKFIGNQPLISHTTARIAVISRGGGSQHEHRAPQRMSGFRRRAEWIWRRRGLKKLTFAATTPPYAAERNLYLYFRKPFDLTAKPSSAECFVSADGRYQLFVNGKLFGRGPARCSPAAQCVDPYDVADALREGSNVIAALVHSYGRATSWYELPRGDHARAFGCGGFFFQMDIRCAEETRSLDSDATWRYRIADGLQRDAPSGSLGFLEYFDAR